MSEWTNAKLCDVANLILGALLFVSPWLFAFDAGLPSQNAIISGIAIAMLSIAALANFAVWEEWLNLIVGLWVVVSPWLMGFQGATAMTVRPPKTSSGWCDDVDRIVELGEIQLMHDALRLPL